ncbi:MAG: InlB B-repeat-containing protein, partial [Roseburia sp.]|nr:InlB B-repeat-containing protein [Roseburia sp.]
MKNMWKKCTVGKRFLAWCLLITMLFDSVSVGATTNGGEMGSLLESTEVVAETEVLETELESEMDESETETTETEACVEESETETTDIETERMEETETTEVETERIEETEITEVETAVEESETEVAEVEIEIVESASEVEAFETEITEVDTEVAEEVVPEIPREPEPYEEDHEIAPHLIANLEIYSNAASKPLFGGPTGITASMPSTGDVNALVFVVDFADMSFSEEWLANVEEYFFGEEDKESANYPYESLAAYYERSSYGKLNLEGEFFYYHDMNNRGVYDGNESELVSNLIDAYVASVKLECEGTEEEKEAYLNNHLKQFDSNSDGVLDGLYINFAGETTGWGSQWWSSVRYNNNYDIGDYILGSICLLDSEIYQAASTIIHETGHMLGLDDYYADDGITNAIGTMDMMSANELDHNGFSKMLLGWIEPEDVTIIEAGEYIENLQLNPYATTGELVLIVPDYEESKGLYTEFYMVEYYKAIENDWLDEMEQYNGLRIYHVNAELNEAGDGFIASNWNAAYLEDASVTLVQAVHSDMEDSHIYGWFSQDCLYREGDTLTPYTLPSSYIYETNLFMGEIGYSGIVVENISLQGDRVSFNAGFENEQLQPKLTYEVTKTPNGNYSGTFLEKIRFNTDIRLSNESYIIAAGELLDEVGNKYSDLVIQENYYVGNSFCEVKIELVDETVVMEPGRYTIVIPAGIFVTSYGVVSEEIRLPYDNGDIKLLAGKKEVLMDIESDYEPDWDAIIDGDGNGYIARIEYFFNCGDKNSHRYYWSKVENYEVVSDKEIAPFGEEAGDYWEGVELVKLEDNRFVWILRKPNDEEKSYLFYVLDGKGNFVSKRIFGTPAANSACGVLDGRFALVDWNSNVVYLYDFFSKTNDSSFEISYAGTRYGALEIAFKRLNENAIAINYAEGWVVYDENYTARIGHDTNGYKTIDVIYSDEKYYVLTKTGNLYETVENPKYVVMVYNSDYQYEKEYELPYAANTLAKIDEGFLTMCVPYGKNSLNLEIDGVQCLYDNNFSMLGIVGSYVYQWFINDKCLYALSKDIEEGWKIYGWQYDFRDLEFIGAEDTGKEKERLEAPGSNLESGSSVSYYSLGSIELHCPIENVEIRYTTDGKNPHRYSNLYTEPILLAENMIDDEMKITIKAYARKEGYVNSDVVTFIYDVSTIVRGNCAGELEWSLDIKSGEFIISGKGAIEDYVDSNAEWMNYKEYIKKIVINEGITKVGDYAFYNLRELKSVTFPNTVTHIGDYAFAYSAISEIELPKNLTTIKMGAFSHTKLKEIVVPENVQELGQIVFEGCELLEKAEIYADILTLEYGLFMDCSSLRDITYSDTIKTINVHCFYNCIALTDFIIKESVETIYFEAFYGCTSLLEIYIPRTVISMLYSDIFSVGTTIIGHLDSEAKNYADTYGYEFVNIQDVGVKVTFVTNSIEEIESQFCYPGRKITEPASLNRVGHIFEGWYTSNEIMDDTTKWDFKNNVVESNITLYAKWKPNTYTLSFDLNCEEAETVESKKVTYNTSYGILPTVIREGYIFTGWYTEKEAGTLVTAETVVSRAENHTLYAHYEAESYSVTFNAGEGTVTTAQKDVTYDQAYGELPEASREGYVFKGWYTEKEAGTLVTAETIVSRTENHTLYARYEAVDYTVTFDAGEGNVDTAQKNVTYDQAYGELPAASRTGYVFKGWYTEKEAGTLVTAETVVSRSENHTLYARYEAVDYTVTFDVGEGNVDTAQKNVTYDQAYGELPVASRTGYVFKGWYTEKEAGTLITAETIVSRNENHTLYAHYEVEGYTVTFDAGEGTAGTTQKNVTYNQR